MPLIWVTGLAGTGKSAICRELESRGYEAYDADIHVSAWFNKETGQKLNRADVPAERTPDFRAQHEWKMVRARIEDLATRAKSNDHFIFLCGVAANENEVRDLFDKVIALTVDEATLRHRISTRTTGNYGKAEHEFNDIMRWHKDVVSRYEKRGYIIIDSTQPLALVTDEVLSIAKDDSRKNKVMGISPPRP